MVVFLNDSIIQWYFAYSPDYLFIRFKNPRKHHQEEQGKYAKGSKRIDVNTADLFQVVNEFHVDCF
jgi:hypothetical protein